MTRPNQIRASLAPYEVYILQQLLRRTAVRLPQKIAVIDGDGRFTHQQLDEYSDRFAAGLASLGIAKNSESESWPPTAWSSSWPSMAS